MNLLSLNPYSLAGFSLGVTCFVLALITLIYSSTKTHRLLVLFNLSCCLWGFGTFVVGQAQTQSLALVGWRFAYIGGLFIGYSFYHFIIAFCELNRKWILRFIYFQGVFWLYLLLSSNLFISPSLRLAFDSIYYNSATPLFSVFFAIWILIVIAAFIELSRFISKVKDDKRIQSLYIFFGFLVGFIGGCSTLLPIFGVDVLYPYGNFAIIIYALILTYAILRHRLLDIKIVLTKSVIPVLVCGVFVTGACFIFLDLNLFSLAGLCLGVSCWLLAFIVFAYSRIKMHKIWALFNVVVGTWGLGTFFVGISDNYSQALISWKFAYSGGIFIAVLFYHVVCEFCGLKRKKLIVFSYIQGFIFAFLNIATKTFIDPLEYLFDSFYYNKATLIYSIWFVFWSFFVVLAFYELFQFIKKTKGIQHTQALYLFIGMLLGFGGGTSTVAPSFGILVYPAWHFTICIYAAISTYAIFKFQIMDIKIAVTRLGIFGLVYSLVLGLPFGIGFFGRSYIEPLGYYWWLIPTGLCAAFATAGPFIYLYLQRKAEERILQEEIRTQELLTKASYGMASIRNLDKLLELIIDILTKSLRLDNAAIYLNETAKEKYVLKVSKSEYKNHVRIRLDDPLIRRLEEKKFPLIFEEIKMLAEGQPHDNDLREISRQMKELSASVIIPAIAEHVLLGFIILGERKDKGIYSLDLVNVLSVLGNQAALAIENALFIQEKGKTLMEQFQKHRLEGLGMLSVNISHQMHNRFQAIMTSAGFTNEIIKDMNLEDVPKEKLLEIIQKYYKTTNSVVENCLKGAEITEAIKNYAKADPTPKPVMFDAVIKNSIALVEINHKDFAFELVRDYPKDVVLWINFATIQDVIYNAVDNSCDAMELRMKVIPEEGYKPEVRICGEVREDRFHFEIQDIGMGIKREHMDHILVPLFTTKGSSNKGTGMGLPAIMQFIEQNNGTFGIKSEYQKGTRLIISLPLATQEQRGINDENIIRG